MGQPSQGANGATASGSTTGSASTGPVVATGDWTKDLVQLAKQAELKKHALTLQLHTAHILSVHATLEAKSRAIQDVKEQKNKLDSERARLLKCLQEINADRDKADLAEGTMLRECEDLRTKITQLSEGEYAIAKADVDRLRADLGQPPLPSLQQTLEERTAQFLTERRLNGNEPDYAGGSTPGPSSSKRTLDGATPDGAVVKRPRGRPKGSKNKKHVST
ncbi:hypothetical protein CC1G_10085 [Coprinopsis cinerea okayama7|uniref:Uncharacterized protein n=1 Tax=Coprinopsis cinerea (strain Okayama-7 / 130 / ATCC MYA-4618 / FGSC 9003) TaxID=240176 RepID=A8NDU5_COPC7|nr:hypothetical protein CC1G_10085 [Coprinopsis cinerea okayama7\|eukprot:XP_001832866.1 hypothetical protein CC1G_10085 [Coprinopsis cinerea okayama7\